MPLFRTNALTAVLCRLDQCDPGWLRCLWFNINDNDLVKAVANIKGGIGVWKSFGNTLVNTHNLTQLLGPLCLWQCSWLELHYCSHLKHSLTKLRTEKLAFQSLGRNNLQRSNQLYWLGKCFQSFSLSLSLSWCWLTIFTCCFEAASVLEPRNSKLVDPPPSHPSS